MTSNNTLTLVPISVNSSPLEADKSYVLKVHSFSIWLDGDIRICCAITPLPPPNKPSPDEPLVAFAEVDYESQDFQDTMQEILDDVVSDGEGHVYSSRFIHHLTQRGYKIIRE
jgi:hypothetical protein